MRFLYIIIALSIVLLMANSSSAKAWRGIVPLKSTRADVERLLGPPTDDLFNYNLPDIHVGFSYSNCRCGDTCKKDDWNVPPDTVILIRVDFKGVVRLADLKVDLTDYEKRPGDQDVPGSAIYKNKHDGFAIETGGIYVSALTYMPQAKDDHMRCPRNSSKKARYDPDCLPMAFSVQCSSSLFQWSSDLVRLNQPSSRNCVAVFSDFADGSTRLFSQ